MDVNLNTFLGLAIWQGKTCVYYTTFHSLDRMTWDENGSYYLGDLHLLNQALFVKAILKVEFRELYFTPPESMPRRHVLWAGFLVLWAELCHKHN